MMDQGQVDAWLADFLAKLKDIFGDRLMWVGHHGSWGRQEAGPESDIDCMVVLDRIEDADLYAFRDIVTSMPDAQTVGSGLLMSIVELRESPRFYLVQFFYGRKVLYGSLQGVVDPPGPEELIADIRLKASDNLHAARHYLLYPHDLPKVVHKLKYPFKNCFYALQSWLLLTQGKFIPLKNEILEYLNNPDDNEVVRVARDWYKSTDDRTAHASYYIELLERWSRGMIAKLESYQA
jgi:hypothetical protein